MKASVGSYLLDPLTESVAFTASATKKAVTIIYYCFKMLPSSGN